MAKATWKVSVCRMVTKGSLGEMWAGNGNGNSPAENGRPGYLGYGEGQGTQRFFCLSLH